MSWQADGIRKTKKRSIIFEILMLVGCFVLLSRMFYLQIIESDNYRAAADKNRISFKLLAPPRGNILDRNGELIATNRKSFRAVIVKEETKDISKTLDNFSKLVPLNEAEKKRILNDVHNKKAFVPVRVKDDLTFDEMALIQLNIPHLAGVSIEENLMRVYPQKELLAHPLGYISSVTEKDLKSGDYLMKIPDVRVGRTGVEAYYEKKLAGTEGTEKLEINAAGREIRVLDMKEATPGDDLVLTLDARFQKIGYDAMNGEAGSAILMDIYTGDILMMVSTPSFDPNIFNYPVEKAVWDDLRQNVRHPLLNKSITGLYSPGSIFKIIVAIAGLEAGVIKEDTKINCSGKLFVGDHPFHCWQKHGHGPLNLKEALQHSCDIYFYEVARQTGADKIIEVADRFGLGEKTGVDLEGEKEGLLPSRFWKSVKYGDAWRLGDTMNLGIGQGFLLTSPLQMVQMMARVANGGLAVKPHLIKYDTVPEWEKISINPKHLALIKKGLNAVVNAKGGTAAHAAISVDGQLMGGKTASTQIRRISLAEREEGLKKQYELDWKDRDHAFFVAYAPEKKPKYALVVAVEHGGGGGSTAAPIAGTIMKNILLLEKEDKKKETVKK